MNKKPFAGIDPGETNTAFGILVSAFEGSDAAIPGAAALACQAYNSSPFI